MKNSKLFFYAAAHSLGILVYVSAVAWMLFNGEKLFGKVDSFAVPLAMLLLFVFSAALTGLLFLGRPVYLYLNGFKKEAVRLLFYSLACLFAATALTFILLYLVF